MGCDLFKFKRFTVNQAGAAMKVGTDGVLLGAWCDLGFKPERVLDVGTGTGLLALMIAQRSESWLCRVDAVEIDESAYTQACENFAASSWNHSISAHHQSMQDFTRRHKQFGRQGYDLIISNPPYFENSLQSPSDSRTTARHATQLSRNELIECVADSLCDNGKFAVIIPHSQTNAFCDIALKYLLFLNKWAEVSPSPGSAPHRSLLLFGRSAPHDAVIPDRLVIETGGRHVYSNEYIELTRDFYLKF